MATCTLASRASSAAVARTAARKSSFGFRKSTRHPLAPRPQNAAFAQRDVTAAFHGTAANPVGTFAESRVEEIMSQHPVVLRVGTSCADAARALLEHNCTSAAVVDEEGRLLGVLTEADLLWKSAGAPLEHHIFPPVFIGAFDLLINLQDTAQVQQELDKILARTVEQAMSKEPIALSINATLSEAAKTLLTHKAYSLPVVDDNEKVVGILSQHDALRGMVEQQLPLF